MLKYMADTKPPPAAAPTAPPLPGTRYMIAGVSVMFPHTAYPSQINMMDRVRFPIAGAPC